MISRLRSTLVVLASLTIAPQALCDDDVLDLVPQDALGVVVIKNLDASDAHVKELFNTVHIKLPTPLALLDAITGIRDGVKPDGDALLAVLPGQAADRIPSFCFFIPIGDYGQLVASFDLPPAEGVLDIRVGEEDMVLARRGDWAILGDRSLRERIAAMTTGEMRPPKEIKDSREWIEQHDFTVIAFQMGLRTAWVWATGRTPGADDFTDPVALDKPRPAPAGAGANAMLDPVRVAILNQMRTTPQLVQWMMFAKATAVGVRIDEQRNARASLKILHSRGDLDVEQGDLASMLPPALYQGGHFIWNGAAKFPKNQRKLLADWFAKYAERDLRVEQRLELDKDALNRFTESLTAALADVQVMTVLTKPGDKPAGLFTNDYLLVSCASAETFADKAREVMRLWNSLNRDAKGGEPLVFDVDEQEMAGHKATLYSLEMPTPEGLTRTEMRQIMEKFFGPDGAFQLWIVPIDDKTVLLARATKDELNTALKSLDRKQAIAWTDPAVADVNKLMSENADARLFFNPADYLAWKARVSEAQSGPVFGGRPKKEFPASPSIGITAIFRGNEITIEAVIPGQTVANYGEFQKPAAR